VSDAVRIVQRPITATAELPQAWHPVLRRVLAGRGVQDSAALDTSLSGLHGFDTLSGMGTAVTLIEAVMRAGKRILVIGDFDADGATSTALAVRALRAMGANDVDYLVPNRFEFGYGLTPEIVALAAQRQPALIITVDNGVSSIDGVASARALGIAVLVTDHHLPGAELPAADAMVNPNLYDDPFPSKNLAGVGVIFYVMSALRAQLRARGWFVERQIVEPKLAELLDLVALGTVADVVSLDQNNRRLVAQGVARIRAGRCQAGVAALINIAGRNRARLTTSDLGFAIGPRLNAAGRLADMSLGIECLLSDDPQRCAAIADELDRLNKERREIEGDMREHAFELIDAMLPSPAARDLPSAFCVFHEAWHQGVVGIVAARVKDRFHRPVVAFAEGEDGTLKGSARSIPGLHIRDALEQVASNHPGLITRFGGHAMAAGLSLQRECYETFRQAFVGTVDALLDSDAKAKLVMSDGALTPDEMTMDLARELGTAAPWGQGFPEPRFEGVFDVLERRIVGTNHARLVLRVAGAHNSVAGIAFGAAEQAWYRDSMRVRAVYKLDINEYRGVESLQLVIDYLEPA
jgi:single-stranded-DNA-specific exonuclease